MKRIFLLLMLAAVLPLQAENLYVLYAGDSIYVDGVIAKSGMTISDQATVTWRKSASHQILKVAEQVSHRVYVLRPAEGDKQRSSVAELLMQQRSLASRSASDVILLYFEDMQSFFSRELVMNDGIRVQVPYPMDEGHFFFLQYVENGENINKKLPYEGQDLIIDSRIYLLDGVPTEPVTRTYSLYYYDTTKSECTLISNTLTLH